MAGVDVGAPSGGRRATNSDINMIPFIDFLMVTIAFLLITAVWTTQSRINANAQVPGPPSPDTVTPPKQEPVLHVSVGENDFGLTWKQAATVLSEVHVPREASASGDAGGRSPELARALAREWAAQGAHRDPSDKAQDVAVIHSDDRMPFKDIVAVLDAIAATQRDVRRSDGQTARVPAFNPTFSTR